MRWFHRVINSTTDANAQLETADAEPQPLPREHAEAHMVLLRLNDRMRAFRAMTERILTHIETQTGLDVRRPESVTYAGGDLYFPTYEWKILARDPHALENTDPRNVTLQLRASLGSDLTGILVYYLLTFQDASGDEHPIHQQPTNIYNEALIRELLLQGLESAGLLQEPGGF